MLLLDVRLIQAFNSSFDFEYRKLHEKQIRILVNDVFHKQVLSWKNVIISNLNTYLRKFDTTSC